MVKASEALKDFIKAQESMDSLVKRSGVSKSVLYGLVAGKQPSGDTIHKMLEVTGFDYEKAFESK